MKETKQNISMHLGDEAVIDCQHPTVNTPQGWITIRDLGDSALFGLTLFPSQDRPHAVHQLRVLAAAATQLADTLEDHERIDALPDDDPGRITAYPLTLTRGERVTVLNMSAADTGPHVLTWDVDDETVKIFTSPDRQDCEDRAAVWLNRLIHAGWVCSDPV